MLTQTNTKLFGDRVTLFLICPFSQTCVRNIIDKDINCSLMITLTLSLLLKISSVVWVWLSQPKWTKNKLLFMICWWVITNKLPNWIRKIQTFKLKSVKGIYKAFLWPSETKAKGLEEVKIFCPSSKVVVFAMRKMNILGKWIRSGWSVRTVMQSFIFHVWKGNKYVHFAPLRNPLRLMSQ